MVSSILLCGGVCMLPGFFARLQVELHTALAVQPIPASTSRRQPKATYKTRFAPLSALRNSVAILNDPCIHLAGDDVHAKSGTAPAWAPSLLPWLGGSLSGMLKTSGREVLREAWDESRELGSSDVLRGAPADLATSMAPIRHGFALPDWTSAKLL